MISAGEVEGGEHEPIARRGRQLLRARLIPLARAANQHSGVGRIAASIRRSGAVFPYRPTSARPGRRRRGTRGQGLRGNRRDCGRASRLRRRRSPGRRAGRADGRSNPCPCRGRWCAPGWRAGQTSRSDRGSSHAARIEQRQEIYIKLALHLRADLVADAALLKLLARKLAAISVAHDLRAAVGLQHRRVLSDHRLRQERRPGFPDAIDHDAATVAMRDSEPERIPAPPDGSTYP